MNFKYGGQWENPKMNIILNTAGRRAKRTKIWDWRYYTAYIGGYFGCPIPWFWFGVIRCTLQNFQFYDFKTLLLQIFTGFQPNFIVSMMVMREYRLCLFGDLPKIKKNVALWNINMEVNGKILKCATHWKWLIVERKGWKFVTCSSMYSVMYGTFHVWFFEFNLRLFSMHFAKFLMLNIFKKLLIPQFSFNFNQTLEKACNPGKYRPLLFVVIGQILNITHFEEMLPQVHVHWHYA